MNTHSLYIHPELDQFMAAGRPIIMVKTFEEGRLKQLLAALASHHQMEFWTWQLNTGLVTGNGPVAQTTEPQDALAYLCREPHRALIWFKDLHHHYNPDVIRGLRDFYYHWQKGGCTAVLSATQRAIPLDLEREMAYLVLAMPTHRELCDEVLRWQNHAGYAAPLDADVVAATLRGLTLAEAWHALTRIGNSQPQESEILPLLQEEKRQLIQKSGTIEFIPRVPGLADLGGMENLKDWLIKRKKLMLTDDDSLREIAPKGMLLMGVSGCGKSLCVKAVSSIWQLPLYRLEMARIFSGGFGSPELAFSDACRLMEEMIPAILWIDEIEMGLSAEGSSAPDPSLSRIFAFFLTWMQEKPPGLFVAATANRIDLLPAEMIRKGRFDQVFFVDLPTEKERRQIFEIHLQKRGLEPDKFNLDVFADGTEGWNGAEIEQAVISAITQARMEERELGMKDLYTARKQIVPISTTMEEQVRHIRNWAYDRAVRASRES